MKGAWIVEMAEVETNDEIDPTMRYLVLRAPGIAASAEPGQFVTFALPGQEPILPRPFDLHFADPGLGLVEFVVRVKGRGTNLLAGLLPGTRLQLQGPFGNNVNHLLTKGAKIALVGRGAGISPLSFIAQRASDRGTTVSAYVSARSRQLLTPFFRLMAAANVVERSDDVHPGYLVTDQLALDVEVEPVDLVFVVGSRRLARAAIELGEKHGFKVYGFAETFMPCGFGHCKACAIPTRSGYILACLSGPVIDLAEVSDEYWAIAPT